MTAGSSFDKLKNTTVLSIYTYDTYGNMTSASVDYGGGITEAISDTYYNNTSDTNYLIGFQTVTAKTTTRGGATGQPTVKTYYDALGRETRSGAVRFDASYAYVDKRYDSFGRLQYESLPFTGTTATLFNTYSYDSYDRPLSIKEASGKTTSYSYSGKSVTTTKEGISSTQTVDTHGDLISVSDPAGTITYNLRPDGQPSSIVAPGSVTTSFTYDIYGRKTGISDPSAGTQTYTYDADGNLASEKNAANKTVSYTYDDYNRLFQKTRTEFTTTYDYNSDGLLSSELSTNGTSTVYTYDYYGRISTVKETVPDGKYLQKTFAYSGGNISSLNYTTQDGSITTENYIYTNGSLSEIKLNATTSIWKLNSVNEFSQPTQLTTGSFSRTYSYNAYGLPTARKAGSFQNFAYSFDSQKGNLTYRKDLKYNIQENFTYDNLNRLTGYSGLSASYDIKGNITKKSDVGSFEYTNSGKPYAVSKAILSQSAIPLRYQYISYTSFKRPALISEGIYTALFTYCGNEERVKMELRKDGAKELIRYYLSGCYEIDDTAVGSVKEKLYLGGDYYTAAAVYVKQGSGSWALYYICRDYLGSITHITNSSGSLYYQYSYDAWGRLRNPSTQAVYPPGEEPALFLGRGYTGHEHLSQFGLINMNARMYDPALGRFLAPDPFVQAPGFSQSFNRYSYCLNNPLRYTDEDGEFWHIIIGAIAGGFANWASNGFKLNSDGLKSFAIGAVGGALSAALPGSMSIFGASLTASTNSFSGSNQSGISVNVSMGLPFNLPINYSIQGGISYYFKNTDLMGNDMSGWETRYGSQWSVDDVFSYGGTTFNSQWSGKVTTNLTTVGNSSFNVKYENDMEPAGIFKYIPFVPKGDGDRYRTAAAQINMGPFGIGTNMMTGDPGPMGNKQHESINGHDTYVAHDGYNPNSHRMGIFYFRLGPLRFGKNSENTRKIFQNQFAHDFLTGGQSKWFEVLDLKPQWYWGFGYSAGGTLY